MFARWQDAQDVAEFAKLNDQLCHSVWIAAIRRSISSSDGLLVGTCLPASHASYVRRDTANRLAASFCLSLPRHARSLSLKLSMLQRYADHYVRQVVLDVYLSGGLSYQCLGLSHFIHGNG